MPPIQILFKRYTKDSIKIYNLLYHWKLTKVKNIFLCKVEKIIIFINTAGNHI